VGKEKKGSIKGGKRNKGERVKGGVEKGEG
jgi:hypothetical protein